MNLPYDPAASLRVLDSRTKSFLEREGYSCVMDNAKMLLMERLTQHGIHSVLLNKETRIAQVVDYNNHPHLHSRTVFENYTTNFRLYNLVSLARQIRGI